MSVNTVTKHFTGGGPTEDGEDSHFTYGKSQTYPGNNFEYRLIPFKADITCGTRQMMPYYSRPIGTKYDPIAELAAVLVGSYGSGPESLLDIVFGVSPPGGKLPFDLPGSMEAVGKIWTTRLFTIRRILFSDLEMTLDMR